MNPTQKQSLSAALLLGLLGTAVPNVSADTWAPAVSMTMPRWSPAAALLPSGRVLVAGGGVLSAQYLTSAEIYDLALNQWAGGVPALPLAHRRTAVRLQNGLVLVAGDDPSPTVFTAYLFDESSNPPGWIGAGNPGFQHVGATLTLLASGNVLLAGGYCGGAPCATYNTAEIYRPHPLNNWIPANSMATTRFGHTATLLPSGQVLVAGGAQRDPVLVRSQCELFNEGTFVWSPSATMNRLRFGHTATRLPNGKVLVAGGMTGPNTFNNFTATTEIYDPTLNSWTPAATMTTPRSHHTATLLASGKVLIAGGLNDSGDIGLCEVYDYVNNSWSMTAPMSAARRDHAATLLSSGQVFIAGGNGTNGAGLNSAEIYSPAAPAAPVISTVSPTAGAVGALSSITVVFSEAVSGVDASDLLINGLATTNVIGSGSNYTFRFPQPAAGDVHVTWALAHGIVDFANPGNPFDATATNATWNYFLAPPSVTVVATNIQALEGQPLVISPTVTGAGPFTFQWQHNGSDIPGATNSTLVITNVTPLDAGRYNLLVNTTVGPLSSADISLVPLRDCNHNGIWDFRDITDFGVPDRNSNGIPDECECPTLRDCLVDAVFIVDVSQSMFDDADALCAAFASVLGNLNCTGPIVTRWKVLYICSPPDLDDPKFNCLDHSITGSVTQYGTTIGGLSLCEPPANDRINEDWGVATAIIAANYPWLPSHQRLIVPISDAGPRRGNPCDPAANGKDQTAATLAITTAVNHQVKVSPIFGSATDNYTKQYAPCVASFMMSVANGTGGQFMDLTSLPAAIAIARALRSACPGQVEKCASINLAGMAAWWTFNNTNTAYVHKFGFGIKIQPFAQDIIHGLFAQYKDLGLGSLPSPIPAEVGHGVKLDGVDDYLEVSHSSQLSFGSGSFSMDCWLRRDKDKEFMSIVDKRNPATGKGYWFYLKNGFLSCLLNDGTEFNFTSQAFVPLDTCWHLVAVAVSRGADPATGVKFYLDGLPYDFFPLSAGSPGNLDTSNSLYIGWNHPALCSGAFPGCLDELEIFRRILTPLEICRIYQAGPAGKCLPPPPASDIAGCPGNLVQNGSFEADLSGQYACYSLDGLYAWSDSSEGYHHAAWVKDGCEFRSASGNGGVDRYFYKHCTHYKTTLGVSHCDERHIIVHAPRYDGDNDPFPLPSATACGTRFIFLDHESDIVGAERTGVESNLLEPIDQNFTYNITFFARSDKGFYNWKGPYNGGAVVFEIFDGVNGHEIDMKNGAGDWGPEPHHGLLLEGDRTWRKYSFNFPGNTHPGYKIVIRSQRNPGVCIDCVCLTQIPIEPGGSMRTRSLGEDGTNDWLSVGTPLFVPGRVGQATYFNGVNSYLAEAFSPELAVFRRNLSAALFVNPATVSQSPTPILDSRSASGLGYALYLDQGRLAVSLTDTNGTHSFVSDAQVPTNRWSHVGFTFARDAEGDGLMLSVNGKIVASFDASAVLGSLGTNNDLTLASSTALDGTGQRRYFQGALDELLLYNSALSSEEMALLAADGAPQNTPEFASVPPLTLFGDAESNVSTMLTIVNNSDGIHYYTWQEEPEFLDDGTDTVVLSPRVTPAAGSITLAAHSTATIPITLARPNTLTNGSFADYSIRVINTQTQNSFSAPGSVGLNNQWRVESLDSAPATVEYGSSRMMEFRVTNLGDPNGVLVFKFAPRTSSGSPNTGIRLNNLPAGQDLLSATVVPVGANIIVRVNATLLSDNENTLHAIQILADLNGDGEDEMLGSASIGLITNAAPLCLIALATAPADQTLTVGQPVSFSVGVSGSGPFAYQWRKDGTNLMDSVHLSGVNTPALNLVSTSLDDAGSYDVVITSGCGILVSPAAFLDAAVNQPAVQIHLAEDTRAVLDILGNAGFSYVIQASTNLTAWSDIGTASIVGPGNLRFTDTQRSNYPARFYRVVVAPAQP